MIHDFPSVKYVDKKIIFEDGKYCNLPMEYTKGSNLASLNTFYKLLLDRQEKALNYGEDNLGFSYFQHGLICYVGLVCNTSSQSKGNTLKKKYPNNKFSKEYILKRIDAENNLINYQEYIPIDVVSQNLHEIRGLNAKITDNIDALLEFDNEEKWDEKFDAANIYLKKIYVASRLTKFILDNTKFYNPEFWDTLVLSIDRYFNPHRCISKIVKIYRYDFKKDKTDITFEGQSSRRLRGDKEYFEILVKIFIENALKYSTIKSIGPKVYLSEKNNEIRIEIRSYGKLIPIEDKENIFFKGYRSPINKSKIDGTGMGLFNAKKLIEKFEGDIEFSTKKASEDLDFEIGWNIFTITFHKTFKPDKNAFK